MPQVQLHLRVLKFSVCHTRAQQKVKPSANSHTVLGFLVSDVLSPNIAKRAPKLRLKWYQFLIQLIDNNLQSWNTTTDRHSGCRLMTELIHVTRFQVSKLSRLNYILAHKNPCFWQWHYRKWSSSKWSDSLWFGLVFLYFLKHSNFFVFQNYEPRFSGKFCLILIRSFPGSFVVKSHPRGVPCDHFYPIIKWMKISMNQQC